MAYEEGLAKLESRARFATIALWTFVAVATLTAAGELLEAFGVIDVEAGLGPLVLVVGLAYLAFTAVIVVSIVVVALWIHRGHANLREAGIDGLEFTPGWAVGWYFIPIANLVMPFKAMNELWSASRGEHDPYGGQAPSAIKAWWAAWIVGLILRSIGSRILELGEGAPGSVTAGNAIGAAGTVGVLIAAVLLRRIVAEVTAAQRGGITAVGVFA